MTTLLVRFAWACGCDSRGDVRALVQKHCKGIEVLTYNAVPSFIIAAIFLFAVSAAGEKRECWIFHLGFNFSCSLSRFCGEYGRHCGLPIRTRLTPFQASICFLIFSQWLRHWFLATSMVRSIWTISAYDDPSTLWHLLTKAPKGIFKLRSSLKTVATRLS